MAFILAMAGAALCSHAIAAVLGLCVGIEEQKRRNRAPSAVPVATVVIKRVPNDLDRLGVKRLG